MNNPAPQNISKNMEKSDFGLIGLAVMGQNLVLNVESRGFQVSVYNRTTATMTDFIDQNPGKKLVGCESLESFVESLASPCKIQIMVKAGGPVDAVIESLIPLLDKDDIIIDGGIRTDNREKILLMWAKMAQATLSKWCIMVLNTATCS